MKANITIKVVIDSEKKTIVAKTTTKVKDAKFKGELSLSRQSTEEEVDTFNDRVFAKATEPLKKYGDLFGS